MTRLVLDGMRLVTVRSTRGSSLATFLLAVVVVTPVGARRVASAEDGLLHQWTFQPAAAAEGSIAAAVGDADATIVGPVRFSDERPRALMLDGDSSAGHRVAVAEFSPERPLESLGVKLPATAITVEAWVRVDKPAEWGGLCGLVQDNGNFERGWILGYRNSSFFFAVSSESVQRLTYLTNPGGFQSGYWYHVAGTYDGEELKLYVDGELCAVSKEQTGPIAYPPGGFLTIGAYHDENEVYSLQGQVEQVSIFERSLPAEEVARRFESRIAEFPEIQPSLPEVADWPTYRRDNLRSGLSSESIRFPLSLAWEYRPRHAPQPAWPPPAKQNFWAKKFNLRPRVTYDRAYHVVSAGDAVYFGSSADHKVYCLDAATGVERWSFYAEAPVRLAPTIRDGSVLFGADDGRVYRLNAEHGDLNWSYRFDETAERWIAGNGRVMNSMPVRTGVLVDEGVVYFCAGLFPNQAVHQVAVDFETGEPLNSSRLNVSAQGYLERRGGRLFLPTGRDPAGAFASQLKRRGKDPGRTVSTLPEEYPFAFIGAEGVRIGGGDGKVTAFAADNGTPLWTAEIEGKAYGLALARGRLFVSTDTGRIYCFQVGDGPAIAVGPGTENDRPALSDDEPDAYGELATRILSESGITQGYCLVLGSGDGRLALQLAARSELKIIVVEPDAEKVAAARRLLDASGVYGRVAVHQRPIGGELPYTDYLFNLVVGEALATGKRVAGDREEIERMLRPGGGVAFLSMSEGGMVRREPLEGVGEWSHMYANPANTVCSSDERVRGTMALQWFGRPGPRELIDRHHRTVAPLWKDGRLFIPGDDRIYAVDAYNGTPLWEVEIEDSRRVAAFRDSSYMSAGEGVLYVARDDTCLALNASTGYIEQTYQVPAAPDGKPRDWGYVANAEKLLVGSGVKPDASRRTLGLDTINEAAYYDFREAVTSDFVYAFDPDTEQHAWTYASEQGAILNPTITIGGGTMFFVESHNPETLNKPSGRNKLSDLLSGGADLVALDMRRGEVLWRGGGEFTTAEHNLYACYAEGKLVVVGSRNGANQAGAPRVMFDVHVFNAETGESAWSATQTQSTEIGGSHGEQDLHPVIVGTTLYCEPRAYELHTGKTVDWGWSQGHRRGCGTISASASAFFYRQSNPTMFDLTSGVQSPVTTTTRPGCWVNMIPAGGLLLIPEASSGCTCNYAVQTSLAFLPIP